MIRRIALHHMQVTPVESILRHKDGHGVTICDYADLNAPVKGLPKIAEYNPYYRRFLPYDSQTVCRCKGPFHPREFIETASAALAEERCQTARLEYYQIFDIAGELVTDASHMGMADLTGNTDGVKFQGSSQEILCAWEEIFSAVQDIPLALLSVICTFRDAPVAEIQMEFAQNVDCSTVFEAVIQKHPTLRMMGCRIPEFLGDAWHVYVSGSHSPKCKTIPISMDRTSCNDFYQELERSEFWGDPDWLQGDIKANAHKTTAEAWINHFNWNSTLDIPETVCGHKITALRLMTNNQHLTCLKIPATVKKLGKAELYGCRNLKEAFLPSVTEINTDAFADCKKLKDLWVSANLRYVGMRSFAPGVRLTIHGPKGSFAEQYANSMGYSFTAVE